MKHTEAILEIMSDGEERTSAMIVDKLKAAKHKVADDVAQATIVGLARWGKLKVTTSDGKNRYYQIVKDEPHEKLLPGLLGEAEEISEGSTERPKRHYKKREELASVRKATEKAIRKYKKRAKTIPDESLSPKPLMIPTENVMPLKSVSSSPEGVIITYELTVIKLNGKLFVPFKQVAEILNAMTK